MSIDVRKIRHKMGMTQEQFATHIGCSLRTVSKWEDGGTISKSREGYLIRLSESLDNGSGEAMQPKRRVTFDKNADVEHHEAMLDRALKALEKAQAALEVSQRHVSQLIEALTKTHQNS